MNKKLIIIGGIVLIGITTILFWQRLQYAYYDFQEYLTLKNKIIWKSNVKLDWEDFIYDPEKNLIDNISTDVGIAARYHIRNSKIEYKSTTVFVPSKSFVSDTTNFMTLRIANVRFDLCEVYRRKLESKIDILRQKDIKDVPLDTLKNQSEIFFNQFKNEWGKFLDIPEDELEYELVQLENRIKLELN
ncbi:hypothetical protein [Aquimarina spongiae]|uniref:Uncharacterized protein n=1 Tax=Aquimarina spongiae TaxID=570521 RepID=A0A1M6A4W1_9FLAO|nr:hypothetical protein [Aquimarina spongiae]SHI31435.1 hypothetical protein SAMN04488508_10184 [Aquimarina spongiae]